MGVVLMNCENTLQLSRLLDWVHEQVATGSQVIGGSTPESDHDYVATVKSLQKFARTIGLDAEYLNFEKYADGRSMSFKYRDSETDTWTNLIVVEDRIELECWIFATKVCRKQYAKGYLRSKETRVLLFEALKAIKRERLS